MYKEITNDLVVLRFKDDSGDIHEIDLDEILEGGWPLDEETDNEMEYLGTWLIE